MWHTLGQKLGAVGQTLSYAVPHGVWWHLAGLRLTAYNSTCAGQRTDAFLGFAPWSGSVLAPDKAIWQARITWPAAGSDFQTVAVRPTRLALPPTTQFELIAAGYNPDTLAVQLDVYEWPSPLY